MRSCKIFRGVLYRGGNNWAEPSRLVPVGGGGLAPPPLTQSGKGAALDDMAPLDLIAAFFLRGAMGVEVKKQLDATTYSFPLCRGSRACPH